MSATQVAVRQDDHVSIVSKEAAIRAARLHQGEAQSPLLRLYWTQVIERLQGGRG